MDYILQVPVFYMKESKSGNFLKCTYTGSVFFRTGQSLPFVRRYRRNHYLCTPRYCTPSILVRMYSCRRFLRRHFEALGKVNESSFFLRKKLFIKDFFLFFLLFFQRLIISDLSVGVETMIVVSPKVGTRVGVIT